MHPIVYLLQTGSPDITVNPLHFTWLLTVVFHPCRQHDIKTMAAVFCLSSSTSTARSSLYSQETGVPSCWRQHVERPSVPHHICTVTRCLQSVSQDFPLFSFLSFILIWLTYYYWLLSLFFSGISHGPCNNWHYVGNVKLSMTVVVMVMMMMNTVQNDHFHTFHHGIIATVNWCWTSCLSPCDENEGFFAERQ